MLTKQQEQAVRQAAYPLQPGDRTEFWNAVTLELGGRAEVGDGELYRVIRKLQWRFFDPPERLMPRGVRINR